MDKIIKRVTIFSVILIVIAVIAVAMTLKDTNSSSDVVDNLDDGNVQIVTLSTSGGQYVLTPSTLKKDIPVVMKADINKLPGCSKGVVISEFGVRKFVSPNDNIIRFTPTKTGTIGIACTMNMYRGSFTVI